MPIETKSVSDGFNIILGSYLPNIAASVTMVTVIHNAPTYDVHEKTVRAMILFWFLFLLHLGLAIFKFLLTFLDGSLWDKMPFLVFAIVITITII